MRLTGHYWYSRLGACCRGAARNVPDDDRGCLTMATELTRDTGQELPDPALLQAIRPSARRMAAGEAAFIRLLHEEIEPLVRRLPDRGWPLCERTARAVLW